MLNLGVTVQVTGRYAIIAPLPPVSIELFPLCKNLFFASESG
ncbi:hypothetical protein FHU10_3158 [Serratia fonticola]|uniref:Uncharacterized protein n=1 Tax=Serratia fonticola TaxID=47917 RepID=A0A542BTJ9_SERFO|nr:hypothetical protein FHU09_4550 [Serratia fonticola]TQI96081.1 hypothetical protein FHU11_1497 [Serratia fonticola]TVZ70578.1 hypothetical protein FHU10_3158 [Serratia fonticola]